MRQSTYRHYTVVLTKNEVLEALNQWLVTHPDDRFGDLPNPEKISMGVNGGELYLSWITEQDEDGS